MISRLDQFVIVIVLVAVLASNRCFQCSSAIAQTCSSLESEWYSSGNVIFSNHDLKVNFYSSLFNIANSERFNNIFC